MNETRKIILKALLLCLALTAVAGVLTVLSSSEVLGRVTGTAFFGTLCALLMLALSTRLDKPATQAAGLLGLCVVVIEFMLILALMWDVPEALGFFDIEDSLFITCWVLVGWGVSGMVFLRLYASPFTRIAGITGLTITILSLIAAAIATWLPGIFYSDLHARWWGVAWAIGCLGALASISLVGYGTPVLAFNGPEPDLKEGSLRHWRWAGILCSATGIAMLIAHLFREVHSGSEAFMVVASLATFIPFANLVLLAPLKPGQRWLGVGTLAFGAITALLTMSIAFGYDYYDDVSRFTAAAAIPTACGSLALIVVARLNARTPFTQTQSVDIRIDLTCPRCRRMQPLALGGAACIACGLKIDVKIEEPRCTQCGYLLYMLDGDACPECGTVIMQGKPTSA